MSAVSIETARALGAEHGKAAAETGVFVVVFQQRWDDRTTPADRAYCAAFNAALKSVNE